jgi:hypothetical protein
MDLAEDVVSALSGVTGCRRCAYAGSLRRLRETIGDIDILAAAKESGPLMRAFTELPYVTEVVAAGTTKTSVRTDRGLSVDLRVVPLDSWGAALQYFTGSKAHNIRTRERAVHQGLKLSEYGLFDVESGKNRDSPERASLSTALAALAALGIESDEADLLSYAQLSHEFAVLLCDRLLPENGSKGERAERAVVLALVLDPIMRTLRRLAVQDELRRRASDGRGMGSGAAGALVSQDL